MNHPDQGTAGQGHTREMLFAFALFVIAFAAGGWFTARGGAPAFWQDKYGPAILLATGHGFHNPDTEKVPAIAEFLALRTQTLDPRALPSPIPVQPFHPMQLLYFYTQLAVAAVWGVTGVSWTALWVLFAVCYALSSLALYGIFRLLMRRALAFPLVVLFLLSALQLSYLQWLRDYFKVPFFYGAVFFLALMVARPPKTRLLVMLGAAYGAWMGIGLGFRDDVMGLLPLFPLTLFCFAPGAWRENLLGKTTAVLLMAVLFVLCAAPILYVRAKVGACTGDHIYLGLLDRCAERLGVGNAPYGFGGPYSDHLMISVTQDHAHRILGLADAPEWYSLEYDDVGLDLIQRLIWTFPADFATRACAAVWRILDGFFLTSPYPAGHRLHHGMAARFFEVHGTLYGLLQTASRWQILLALLLLAARNRTQGLFALGMGLYLFGLTSLQFNLRHHFHWAAVGPLATGFLLEQTLQGLAWLRHRTPLDLRKAAVGPLAVLLVGFVVIPGALQGLRLYQRPQVAALLRSYEQAPWKPLKTIAQPQSENRTRLLLPEFARIENLPEAQQAWSRHASLLAVELTSAGGAFPLTLKYTPTVPGIDFPGMDFTWTVQVPASTGNKPVRLYLPVYYWEESHFDGLEVPAEQAGRLIKIEGVQDETLLPSVLLFATLGPDWQSQPLYLRLLR